MTKLGACCTKTIAVAIICAFLVRFKTKLDLKKLNSLILTHIKISAYLEKSVVLDFDDFSNKSTFRIPSKCISILLLSKNFPIHGIYECSPFQAVFEDSCETKSN